MFKSSYIDQTNVFQSNVTCRLLLGILWAKACHGDTLNFCIARIGGISATQIRAGFE